MPRVRVNFGREAPAGPVSRARALDGALTAAGEPGLLPTYDMTRGSEVERRFFRTVIDGQLPEMSFSAWPCEEAGLSADPAEPVFRDGEDALYVLPGGVIAAVGVGHGWASVRVAGPSLAAVRQTLSAFQTLYTATYLTATDDRVPVTFWMNGSYGPVRRLRMIDASPWETVQRNYPPSIRGELEATMRDFEPGKGGQLLLWQGEPGTGKTWALRALVSEWLPWAEFHYITDPDAFFVEQPSYMVDVLLAETYSTIDPDSGRIFEESEEDGKWRVLILEDTGELLSANAKEKYGQGLSRLLNVVDGMIGQGLRVLVLVTTNDELGELNAAVRRPGRCASQLVFPPFTEQEAAEWLGVDEAQAGTVAELYDRAAVAVAPRDPDFTPEPEDARDLMASADEDGVAVPGTNVVIPRKAWDDALAMVWAAKAEDIRANIARVAEEHQDEAEGYGQAAFVEATGTVLYVCGDWTDPDPISADMLAIDGVDAFVCEAEGQPDGWCDAEVVYGGDPFSCGDDVLRQADHEAQVMADLVELASRPL